MHDLGAETARFDPSRPTHHQRHALATFVDPRLAFAQRGVVGRVLIPRPLNPVLEHVVLAMSGLHGFPRRVALAVAVDIAAVVGEENEERVFGEPLFVERVEDATETVVHALQHRRHDRVALLAARISLLGELAGVFLLVTPGAVHAVLPEVEEKGFVCFSSIGFNEPNRLIGEPVGDVFALRSVGDVAHLVAMSRLALRHHAVRRKVTRRSRIGRAEPGRLEAILVRPVRRRRPEVPLAEVPRPVARVAQDLRQGDQLRLEVVLALRVNQRLRRRGPFGIERRPRLLRREVPARRGDEVTTRVLPAHQRHPRRRTQGHRIRIREPHRQLRKARHVRCLVVFGAIRFRIHPAHVIDQEEHDVGPVVRSLGEG